MIGHNADQILVVDVLLAVGQRHKTVVDVLQLFAAEGKAELFQSVPERGAPECLPSTRWVLATPTRVGVMIS